MVYVIPHPTLMSIDLGSYSLTRQCPASRAGIIKKRSVALPYERIYIYDKSATGIPTAPFEFLLSLIQSMSFVDKICKFFPLRFVPVS